MLQIMLRATLGLSVGLGLGLASAQSLRNSDQPAEFPPASYTGKQYIDSKGCVFVRAGFDGAVTWVPRVTRSRKVLCGQQPTFAGRPTPAPPVVANVPAVRPVPVIATPRVVAAPVPARPAPPRVVTVTPPPAPVATNPAPGVRTACPNASAFSQQYLNPSRFPVRCGPQAENPNVGRGRSSSSMLVVPAGPEIAPPEGYRAAFDDGRFNPNRGKGTYEGHLQMRLVWTAGVPRRLVDQNTGRDVTSLFPGLKFPFINMRQQKRYAAANSGTETSRTVLSTKNVVPEQAAPSGHRYVQVGTFGVAANAQNSAARLQALGLPVGMASFKKKGKTYRVVLAGPFSSAGQLQAALNAARRGGFPDAITRK